MTEWKSARKLPVEIEYREVRGEREQIDTREGTVVAYAGDDYVIRGVEGELYPIGKDIFEETYQDPVDEEKLPVPVSHAPPLLRWFHGYSRRMALTFVLFWVVAVAVRKVIDT